ncbi:serine/threonine protein kinase [Virgisporangium aurantiacum]|uniref:non-specific serine/threonine protein kinase n=1 Tax=Virgisporangium aurantiacum TaxID=175570 RepID=A0A8J3ZL26_9ACTN|nr:serine/threonine protein kinase [Virgisporangium aurantiacum]
MFYDSPERWDVTGSSFRQTLGGMPQGWKGGSIDTWLYLAPADAILPPQGWKIHVSTCLSDAQDVLAVVYDYCVEQRIAFKFLPTKGLLIARNLKYAERSGSGKFITIYPPNEVALERVLNDLNGLLAGRRGPYILSDLRWDQGPLYVRYGGFARRYCRDSDVPVPAIEDPSGTLVPDRRTPVFSTPEWVAVPGFLESHRAALGSSDPPAGFPFDIERALHFSNGGGIYLARDRRSGDQVVLKEARPFAGLDPHGADAVSRLEREMAFLRSLADVDEVVDCFEDFELWEHRFLVQEYVEGQTVQKAALERFPLIRAESDAAAVAEFTEWILGLLDQVEAVLGRLHERGIVFGDLHPNNVMVRPDGRIAFIDFEMSYRIGEAPNVGVGAPGYVPTDGRTGPAADLYAMACMRLAMFLPLTMLFNLDPGKARTLADAVVERYPVPAGYAQRVLDMLDLPTAGPDPGDGGRRVQDLIATLDSAEPDWTGLCGSLASAILTSATPDRPDRLFPGDIEQFATNGFGLAHGAAGVLYALGRSGNGTYPEHEEWLLRAVRDGRVDQHAGFYDGLHGIAFALDQLDRPADAAEVLDRALRTPLEGLPSDLFGGLAGVGLNVLHFAEQTGDAALDEFALDIGDLLAGRLAALPEVDESGTAVTPTGRAGLMRGATGQALFLLRLYERTDDRRWLALARQALDRDLRYCIRSEKDGSIQVNEGWRILPYVASGSAGVGMVLQEYLHHAPDDELLARLHGIRLAAQPEFVIGSGLFNGRAGLIGFLARLRGCAPYADREPGADLELDGLIERHRRRFAWHALDYRGTAAFPGDQLLRLSMDLATGNAGVLFALHAADSGSAMLPFLDRTARRRPVPVPTGAAGGR